MLGRGDIIYTNTVEIPNRKSHVLTFLASFLMVPKAQVIVYFVKDDEIISDKLEIEFAEDLQNFVSLSSFFPKKKSKFIYFFVFVLLLG